MATVTETSGSSQFYLHESLGKGYLGETSRPWMSKQQEDRLLPQTVQLVGGLYGTRIRAVFPVGSTSGEPCEESSLLHRTIPDELLLEIFHRLKPWTLGCAACVCRKWKYAALTPSLWHSASLRAWQPLGAEDAWGRVQRYGGSWRRMWKERPRIRTDGLYVARNTYIRVGIVEWTVKNPVHIVCYYRYLRFLPSGKFYYRVSSQVLKDVAKSMVGRPASARPDDQVQSGRYTLTNDEVEAAILYPSTKPTVLRIRTRLRGTCVGANNRMDILSLITAGIHENEIPRDEEDVLEALEGWEDAESHNPDVPAVKHKRGMAPFVFVSFDDVDTDILNLPYDKMDYYLSG